MYARILFIAAFSLTSYQSTAAENLADIALTQANFNHISFKRISPNQLKFGDRQLEFQVNKSSSFVFMPFSEPRETKSVAFQWKSQGIPNIEDAAMEESRGGDDAVMRIGLLLAGPSPELSFLAPNWIKQVRSLLKHSSDKLLYLMPATKHTPGSSWVSPYSDDVSLLAVNSRVMSDHWQQSVVQFPQPLKVVGLWIMADGDNTSSTFTTWLRKLELRP